MEASLREGQDWMQAAWIQEGMLRGCGVLALAVLAVCLFVFASHKVWPTRVYWDCEAYSLPAFFCCNS